LQGFLEGRLLLPKNTKKYNIAVLMKKREERESFSARDKKVRVSSLQNQKNEESFVESASRLR
jgi:hypothetical protein